MIRWDMHFLNLYFFNDTMYLPSYDEGLFKSSDGGYTLSPINNGFSSNNIRYIIKPRENILISLTGSGIYRSTDMGNYWSKLDHSGLTSTQINNIYYSDDGDLYACIGNGVGVFTGDLPVELISFTGKAEVNSVTLDWSTSTEINNRGFEIERSVDQSNWSLIGFKNGNGTSTITHNYSFTDDLDETNNPTLFYRLKQIDFNGSFDYSQTIEVNIIPAQFSLMQGYPNPFNSTSIIKWQTPISGHISLIVYDVLGKIAAVLVNEAKQPGIYETAFNSDNLASGVYYYQLKARGFVETKKLVLIK